MTTILVATQPEEIRNLLPWTCCFARSRGDDVHVVLPQRKKGETRLVQVSTTSADDDSELVSVARQTLAVLKQHPDPGDTDSPGRATAASDSADGFGAVAVGLFQLLGDDWSPGLAAHLQELKPALLIVPAPDLSRDPQERQWQTELLDDVHCDVLLLRDDAVTFKDGIRVAALLSHESDNEATLRVAAQLTTSFDGVVTAIFVQPPVTDLAPTVGRRQLESLLRRTVSRDDFDLFQRKVVVASRPADAYERLQMDNFDLILFGTTSLQETQRFLRNSPVSEGAEIIPAVGVLRQGTSFGNRLLNALDLWIRSFVPQLSREDRVELVGRIQSSSQWDFDFVLLISLATLIACFGLAEDSAPVIVGAMLVAPLMTPIAGVGLGVAHANSYLSKGAFRTALRGFATAVIIGILFGVSVRVASALNWLPDLLTESGFTPEMERRVQPQFYDLLIALVSGIAAAYAMGRPNLYSALPGVAIAAALVPPIATCGIALAYGQFTKSAGALLLFFTNMVTIILGTSLVFRAVGIRSQKDGPATARWPRYTLLLLVLLSILVTIVIELHQRSNA